MAFIMPSPLAVLSAPSVPPTLRITPTQLPPEGTASKATFNPSANISTGILNEQLLFPYKMNLSI